MVVVEDDPMVAVSALDKKSALVLLAITKVAPDGSITDAWEVYETYRTLGGMNGWVCFTRILIRLERLGLIWVTRVYKQYDKRKPIKYYVALNFRPTDALLQELRSIIDARPSGSAIRCTSSSAPDLIKMTFRLPRDLDTALADVATSLGVSKSDLIREALAAGLKYVENTGRLPQYECDTSDLVVRSFDLDCSLILELERVLDKLGSDNKSDFIRRSILYYFNTSVGLALKGESRPTITPS
jgi:metal-responsive CopG/Arc/MetJ family transcriptional regulator